MTKEYEIEETGFGGRVKDAEGEVIGVATRLPGGTFSALAFKPQRVRSMSSRSGFKTAPETSLGTHHESLDEAAQAIAEAFLMGGIDPEARAAVRRVGAAGDALKGETVRLPGGTTVRFSMRGWHVNDGDPISDQADAERAASDAERLRAADPSPFPDPPPGGLHPAAAHGRRGGLFPSAAGRQRSRTRSRPAPGEPVGDTCTHPIHDLGERWSS